MERAALFVFGLVAIWLLSGCTLIGLGVGAAMSAPTKVEVTEHTATHAERGDAVQIEMTDGEQMTGIVGKSDATRVEITPSEPGHLFTAQGEATSVLIERIATLRVYERREVKSLDRAGKGAAFGFALDASIALLALMVYGVSQIHFNLGFGFNCHASCN